MKRVHYIFLFLTLTTALFAQNEKVMQMVKRVIPSKEYHFTDDFLLEIDAEKSKVVICVVPGDKVKLYLEQSVTNTDVRVAERELKYSYFIEKKERNRLYLSNYVQLPVGSRGLTSIVNNKYIIEVPEHCHVKINNELGDVMVEGLKTSLNCDLQYSSLNLENVEGKCYINSRIGDVSIRNSKLQAEMLLESVDLKMYQSGGSYYIDSQFGSISCTTSEQLSLLDADLEHCEITLINRTMLDYDYAVTTLNANVSVLDDVLKQRVEKEINKESLLMKSNSSVGTIIIKSNYSDINLY